MLGDLSISPCFGASPAPSASTYDFSGCSNTTPVVDTPMVRLTCFEDEGMELVELVTLEWLGKEVGHNRNTSKSKG